MVTKRKQTPAIFVEKTQADDVVKKQTNSLKIRLDDMGTIQPKTAKQREFFDAYKAGDYFMALHGVAGTGKALRHGEKVLTPSGFVNIEDIKLGDSVTTPDNTTEEVVGVYPQGVVEMYKVTFQDGLSIDCCGDHLWQYHIASRDGAVKVSTTKELLDRMSRGQRILVPLTEPVTIQNTDYVLPLKPYTLGVLLGDGSISTSSIAFTSTDSEIVANVKGDGYEVTSRVTDKVPAYGVLNISNIINDLGLLGTLSNTKFIPEEYKQASIDDRFSLIQGLFDTDGTCGKGGDVSYTSVSLRLTEDIRYVLRSLGFTATLTSRIPTYTYKGEKKIGQLAYTLHVRGNYKHKLFKLSRKIERVNQRVKVSNRIVSIDKIEEDFATCIGISGSKKLFITTGFAVTHNTYIAFYKALEEVLDKGNPYTKLVIIRSSVQGRDMGHLPGSADEKMSMFIEPYKQIATDLFNRKDAWDRLVEQGYVEFISTSFVRGTTFNNAIIMLDEAQNCNLHELDTVITRVGHTSKFFICGDFRQADLRKKDDKSGLLPFFDIIGTMKDFTHIEFGIDDIVRSSLVKNYIIAKLKWEDSFND